MKVLIGCLYFREFTGSEMYVFELAKNLIDLECDVTVTSPNIGGVLTDLAISLGIKIHSLNLPFVVKDYDIIHSQHRSVTENLLSQFPNKKMICSIHSEIIPDERPIIHPNIKKYIAIRPEIKNYLINDFLIPEDSIEIIYNPINVEKYNSDNTTDYGYTLFVGTIDILRRKSIFDLVEHTKNQNRELWIVGKNHSNYLGALILYPHVKYFDSTYNVESFVKNCKETAGILLGRTTIEGWLTGKPGWIYNIDYNGNILNKEYHPVPENLNRFNSKTVVKQIKEEYKKIIL